MIREAICEGSDVEEALEKAKAALGIGDTDEYDFEVLQREEKKRFGLFGGKPAKVRAFVVIQEKAERFRRLALFNVAPDIKLNDSIDLQSIESEYTVLFFYDHDCDLCHQEMRDLDSVCAEHPDISVLAIDLNMESSGGFAIRPKGNGDLKSHIQYRRITNPSELIALSDAYDIETTPLIFVLDKDKRIIAKKIRARQIPLVL